MSLHSAKHSFIAGMWTVKHCDQAARFRPFTHSLHRYECVVSKSSRWGRRLPPVFSSFDLPFGLRRATHSKCIYYSRTCVTCTQKNLFPCPTDHTRPGQNGTLLVLTGTELTSSGCAHQLCFSLSHFLTRQGKSERTTKRARLVMVMV